ncbi:Coenzyme A biosynthesis protein 3 [Pseudocercospora fuligena]|uniref:Coenzyme A biosynthesis protein 3 n=1 Tax=Pseudocercospora fuligena TaxID=685502 RepID=A0A8H6RGC3_9PEZI|nr:Coenzyme A biosynthesis protein 3 [Pseudocercospora fuligena]
MAVWQETDKALASMIRGVPTLIFLAGMAYWMSRSSKARETPAKATSKSNSDLPRPPILKALDHVNDHKLHLLLAATGSVATIKIPNIIQALSHHTNLSIRVIITESASQFLQGQSHEQPSLLEISKLPNVDAVYRDEDEWHEPWVRGNSILHIELRRWADLMVIAPLSANALAKIANGFSDTLLYSAVRAWDTAGLIDAPRPGISLPYNDSPAQKGTEREGKGRKGIIVAPAMNTAMWNHPATAKHMNVLEGEWNVENGGWFEVLRPIEKRIACGDTGSGGMKEWTEIVRTIEKRLRLTTSRGPEST